MIAGPLPPDVTRGRWCLIEVIASALQAGISPERIRHDVLANWAAAYGGHDFLQRHSEGLLLLAEGDPVGAAAALEAALADDADALYVPLRASLRTALATARLASGDRSGALTAVKLALDDLAGWPGWRRDRAEALLRRLEGGGARSDGELTTREREVASLVSEGMTNSQLAERLFISPRTAAVHVSNILMKLGLTSRAEIAAWAVRHEVVLQSG